ncbi:MAG: pirin family protein [Gammaproteobacteria bacterium]|nr:pirin family protein [Gammaproteobacteria bacterium]
MSLQLRDVTVVPEGDGVEVKRLFPLHGFMNFDPFVLWDHFNIGPGRGFPDHPHRGFEAITYMFDGGMNHKDNLGNESFVTPGGAQRFTAGSGMVHSEMPAENGDSNGIQLWINLPKRLKQFDPDYQQVEANEFPVKKLEGGQVKVLVGEGSPLKLKTEVIYQHINLDKQSTYQLELKVGMRGIIYLMSGKITVNQQAVNADQALFVEDTERLELSAEENSQFMICMGMPHGEPIRQHGPFVD